MPYIPLHCAASACNRPEMHTLHPGAVSNVFACPRVLSSTSWCILPPFRLVQVVHWCLPHPTPPPHHVCARQHTHNRLPPALPVWRRPVAVCMPCSVLSAVFFAYVDANRRCGVFDPGGVAIGAVHGPQQPPVRVAFQTTAHTCRLDPVSGAIRTPPAPHGPSAHRNSLLDTPSTSPAPKNLCQDSEWHCCGACECRWHSAALWADAAAPLLHPYVAALCLHLPGFMAQTCTLCL